MKHFDPVITVNTAKPLTLYDAKLCLKSVRSLSPTKFRDYTSALNRFSEWCDLPLDNIAATHGQVRALFEGLSPGGVGVSKRRFENVRSAINRILQLIGAPQVRHIAPISPIWIKFISRAKLAGDRGCLSKFARFCSARNVLPEQVTDDVSSAFLDHLQNGSLVAKPREKHQTLCRAWNRLVEQTGSNIISRLTVPKYGDRYWISREQFPISLQKQMADYHAYLCCSNPLADRAPHKPLRKVSADYRIKQLYSAAAALVQSGMEIDQITDLSILVEIDNAKKILKFYLNRKNGEKSKMLSDIAQGLAKVALRYLEVPEDQMNQLRELKKRVKVEMNSMTDKNREVLQVFNRPEMVSRFKLLPHKIFETAQLGDPTNKKAILAQKAVAIAILMYAPMRLKNLGNLNLTLHLNGKIHPGKITITIPADEVKNEEHLVFELPEPVTGLVDEYVKTFRPLLLKLSNDFLFPGQGGRPKSFNNLSQQIAKLVHDELGVRLTAHQFRHLMGKIFLDNNPGQYEVLRRVLGHRSIDTTIAYYAGEETRSAVQHFQGQVFKDMEELPTNKKIGGSQ